MKDELSAQGKPIAERAAKQTLELLVNQRKEELHGWETKANQLRTDLFGKVEELLSFIEKETDLSATAKTVIEQG